MVTKDMARSEWTRIRAKDQIILPCSCGNRQGKISLLKMLDVRESFCRVYDGKEIILADNGYYWLQFALEGDHVWFTVMFDDQGNLLQIYIDVTNGNDTVKDDPTFEDLFLDYVVYRDHVYELDRDELDEAFRAGCITKEQYDTAQNSGKVICHVLREHLPAVKSFFLDRFHDLQKVLEPAKQPGATDERANNRF